VTPAPKVTIPPKNASAPKPAATKPAAAKPTEKPPIKQKDKKNVNPNESASQDSHEDSFWEQF